MKRKKSPSAKPRSKATAARRKPRSAKKTSDPSKQGEGAKKDARTRKRRQRRSGATRQRDERSPGGSERWEAGATRGLNEGAQDFGFEKGEFGSIDSGPLEDLAALIGEQTATVMGAMDRWFEHLLARAGAGAAGVASNAGLALPADSTAAQREAARHISPGGPRGQVLARFDAAESWSGWRHHQSCATLAGGHLQIRQQNSAPGVATPKVKIEEGGLVRFTLEGFAGSTGSDAHWHVRLADGEGMPITADLPIEETDAIYHFYVPRRVSEVRLYLVALRPSHGAGASIRAVVVERVEIDDYQAHFRGDAPVLGSLATIPQRVDMLYDSVYSLLAGCDRVRVFMNGYSETPSFLTHPRIETRRSQSFDDHGDAGKFAWIDSDPEPGYRVVADDDLIFPPDFVRALVNASRSYDNKAIVGVHGILLKQPIKRYYDKASRHALHFQSELKSDRTVHILGTNAVCFHSSLVRMRWPDFMWPNMADIFLARYAQRNAIPMIAVARHFRWVLQNAGKETIDTIFDHSERGTGSRFDTSWMQDVIASSCAPFTLQRTPRPKIVVVALLWSEADLQNLELAAAELFSPDFDWAIIAVPVGSGAELSERLRLGDLGHEIHIMDDLSRNAADRINDGLRLARQLGFAALAVIGGGLQCLWGDWLGGAVALLSQDHPLAIRGATAPRLPESAAQAETAATIFALISPSLATSMPLVDSRGEGLGRALWSWLDLLGEAAEGEQADANSLLPAIAKSLQRSSADGERRSEAIALEIVEGDAQASAPAVLARVPGITPNEVFEQVLVINLDRRPDRWEEVSERLDRAGIAATRIPAVDGKSPEVLQDYRHYLESPIVDAPDARHIQSSREFYLDYDSQSARVGFAAAENDGRAIRSAGAWGYLRTWQGILERALRERRSSILVFDDDVVFHRQTPILFAAAIGGLPDDWMMLQLGSLQYHWEPPWLEWRGGFLYRSNGAAIGSHAVGIRFEAMPYLLDQVSRMQMPFDIGPLSAAVRAFRERCFVAYPNIAIQSLEDSEINSSTFQTENARRVATATYRWRIEDYDFGARRPLRATKANKRRVLAETASANP